MFLFGDRTQGSIAGLVGEIWDGWAPGVCGTVWNTAAVHCTLGRAALAWRFCVRRVRRAGGLAAEGASSGLRVWQVPPAGIGDRRNGVSPDANRSREVVSCRLPDGPRQARRFGQVFAAGVGGGVSDGLDHGAQAAPRAERGPSTPAMRFAGGGRNLHWRSR